MDRIESLLRRRNALIEARRSVQSTSDLRTNGGRRYLRWLCSCVAVEMAIEAENKKGGPIEGAHQQTT